MTATESVEGRVGSSALSWTGGLRRTPPRQARWGARQQCLSLTSETTLDRSRVLGEHPWLPEARRSRSRDDVADAERATARCRYSRCRRVGRVVRPDLHVLDQPGSLLYERICNFVAWFRSPESEFSRGCSAATIRLVGVGKSRSGSRSAPRLLGDELTSLPCRIPWSRPPLFRLDTGRTRRQVRTIVVSAKPSASPRSRSNK